MYVSADARRSMAPTWPKLQKIKEWMENKAPERQQEIWYTTRRNQTWIGISMVGLRSTWVQSSLLLNLEVRTDVEISVAKVMWVQHSQLGPKQLWVSGGYRAGRNAPVSCWAHWVEASLSVTENGRAWRT